MAGYTTPVSKADCLNLIVGKVPTWAGGGANRTTYLGLAVAMPLDGSAPTLSNISEVTTGGYARVAVTWNNAEINGNLVKVVNQNSITLGPVSEDMTPAYYAFLTTAAAGTVGDITYVWELVQPVSALAQKPIYVPASALIIE